MMFIACLNKLQSSSAEQLENQSAERKSQLKKELGTPDILQSSEVNHSSLDTAEGSILPLSPLYTPSAVTPIYYELK